MKQTLTNKMVEHAYEKYLQIPLDESTKESKWIIKGNYVKQELNAEDERVPRYLAIHEFAYMLGIDGKFCKYWFGFKLKGL